MKDGVTITDAALAQIVVGAAEQVEGVRVRRRRGVEPQSGRVNLAVSARYGAVLPDLARDVQARVAEALAGMCDLRVSVDVSIEELE